MPLLSSLVVGDRTEIDSADLLEQFLRGLPLAVAIFDAERCLARNEAWVSLCGATPNGSLVGPFPRVGERLESAVRRCLEGAPQESGRERVTRPDGQADHMKWQVTPWRLADGRGWGIVVSIGAITAQVEAEERLAEREALIRELFEQSPIGLNLCRMDGLWLESNPAFLDIIGYTRAEADVGLTYWQLTPRKYDADEATQLELLRARRRYGPYEKEFIRKDGRLVPVRLNGFIVSRDGEDYIWSLIEDLSTQRELERRIEEERAKAVQAAKLAAMGEMAASFAHEINNPLGIIDGYAYLLADAIEEGDRAVIDEGLSAIREAVQRAAKIVQGLRKISRRTDDQPDEKVSLGTIVAESINLCKARILTHGVGLEVEVESDVTVLGNSIELSQVVINLLNNAFDAVRGCDQRWIRVKLRAGPEGAAELSVQDSGPGVPAELQSKIFEPFVTTKPAGEGTGLGLSISKSILERHGGDLRLDAAAKHTRFIVSLPRSG